MNTVIEVFLGSGSDICPFEEVSDVDSAHSGVAAGSERLNVINYLAARANCLAFASWPDRVLARYREAGQNASRTDCHIHLIGEGMPQAQHRKLEDYLSDSDREALRNVIVRARRILEKPVDLAYTDHTTEHKKIVHAHLDSFLGPWLDEQAKKYGLHHIGKEVIVLLSATYLHDIGMQFIRPDMLAHLPSLPDEVKNEAAKLTQESINEQHRQFARRYHHLIAHDWIVGSRGDIRGWPNLAGLEGRRLMVARVVLGHNIWLTDKESYDDFKKAVRPSEEPEGTIRIDLLAAFLRLADVLDQDKRRVDIEAAKRLTLPLISKVHWWKHHYVNACRIDGNTDHSFPLKVAFRLPPAHESERDWLLPALYSATTKEIEAEVTRLRPWLGRSGIHVEIPELAECNFEFDPDAEPMPGEVLDAFRKTWRQAEGAASRARLHGAAEEGKLTAEAVTAALPGLSAAIEIEDYVGNVHRHLQKEFRDYPYSPLELRIESQPELRSALDQLERQFLAPQAKPHPIVLVGAPGGGKTMLLRRYVWEWSGRERGEVPLPVYIQATRFGSADWAANVETRLGSAQNPCSDQEFRRIVTEALERFEALLARTLCELAGLKIQHDAAMRSALTDILARTPLAVLFDGINELPPILRDLGAWAIHAFVQRYRAHRVVVTSRTGDFRPLDFPDRLYCELMPMTEAAVRAYWSGAGVSAAAIHRFFSRAAPGMRELVQTPMAVFMTGELLKLPDAEAIPNQGRLYQRYVRETMRQWRNRPRQCLLSAEQAHALLSEIAFRAFESLQVSFSAELVENTVAGWLGRLDASEKAPLIAGGEQERTVAVRFIGELMTTGFLIQVGDSSQPTLRFRHHTFQDYFAAVAITSRWEQLPAIVAQPVFHEAVGLLAGVVEEPALFIERLAGATSAGWGYVQLLPLLFRVIGASPVPIPRPVLLRIFAAALPLYSAAVGLLFPFAAEVLCYLFAQVHWQVLGQFLAFIAGSPERPEWERELARVDVVTVMNQEGLPAPQALRPVFASRIPPQLIQDHETAKAVLEAMIEEDEQASSLGKAPLLLAGITGSLALTFAEKIRIAQLLSKLSLNQLTTLQAILVHEICDYGSLCYEIYIHYERLQGLLIGVYAEIILHDADQSYESGDKTFARSYLATWSKLGCKHPFIARIAQTSMEIPAADLPDVLERLRTVDIPCGLVVGFESNDSSMAVTNPIEPRVACVLRELRDQSTNPFLVAWLYRLFNQRVPGEVRQRLEPMVIASGAPGYFLTRSEWDWTAPEALKRYEINVVGSEISDAIDQLMAEDSTAFLQLIVGRGLIKNAIFPLLVAAGDDIDRLKAIAIAISALDHEVGLSVKVKVIDRVYQIEGADAIETMIADLGIAPKDVLDYMRKYSASYSDNLIKYISSNHAVNRVFGDLDFLYLKSKDFSGQKSEAFSAALSMFRYAHKKSLPPQYTNLIEFSAKLARNLNSGEGHNPHLEQLVQAMVPPLREGGVAPRSSLWPAAP